VTVTQQRKRKAARSFALTEYGNGERLVDAHGPDLHWLPTLKAWVVWDGGRWARDESCEVERRAKQVVREMWRQVADIEETDFRNLLKKWALQSEAIGKVRAMIEHARSEPGVAVAFAQFDARPMLFNVANGTLELTTQDFREHARADLLTKRSAVSYDPGATCPRWEQFLGEIFDGDADLVRYVQRAVGYTLTGDTREQCLHLMHGTGSNGKTTFLEVLTDLFGDYGTQADFATFLESKRDGGIRNDIARLAGARLVRSSEVGEGKRLNESMVKTLTGTDTISARFLYTEAFEFRPIFKLWLAVNDKPVIRGTDFAIWRRVRLLPFLVSFTGSAKDDTLRDALRRELPGILNWCLRGTAAWFEEGLKPPAVVTLFTEQYRAESDVLGHFIDECCHLESGSKTSATELYSTYKRWAEEGKEYVWSQTVFGRRLEVRGHATVKSDGRIYRRGLVLRQDTSSTNGGKPWF
jgi:putative DNA primase/helicase